MATKITLFLFRHQLHRKNNMKTVQHIYRIGSDDNKNNMQVWKLVLRSAFGHEEHTLFSDATQSEDAQAEDIRSQIRTLASAR